MSLILDGSLGVTVNAGTAALPAVVSATGTADTGLWFPAADTVVASTAGTERLRIDSSGNVGIGTASPLEKLSLASGYLTIGNDGITSSRYGNAVMDFGDGTGYVYRIKNRSGTPRNILNIRDNGMITIGNTATLPAAILNVISDGDTPFRISSTAGGTQGDWVTVNTSGNVGIGATAPAYKLEVSTDSAGKPGTGGLWTVVSDERIKINIVPANLDRCYEIVKSVPLKHFAFAPGVYTDDQINDKQNLGWIAQDVQKVFPKAVSVKPFTMKTDIPDGVEDYEEQDFTLETVETTETSIKVINGKPVQVSKVVSTENKVLLFDTVDVLDEAGNAVMESYEVSPAVDAVLAVEGVEAVDAIDAADGIDAVGGVTAITAVAGVEKIDAVMGTRPVTYQMPRMVKKSRPKVRREVIEDCLDLNGGQMHAALYGAVQALMAKVETLEAALAAR